MARGEHQAVVRVLDARPEQARGVEQHQLVGHVDPLLALGHRRLVADVGHPAPGQRIDQSRLADVRYPHHHQAQGLERVVPVRGEFQREPGQLGHVRGLAAAQRHRLHTVALRGGIDQRAHPGGSRLRVGKVRLVQYLQAGALPVPAQRVDHRVAAGARQAGIDHLDHEVYLGQRLRSLLAGAGHVAWEPSDRHCWTCFPVGDPDASLSLSIIVAQPTPGMGAHEPTSASAPRPERGGRSRCPVSVKRETHTQ